MPCDLGAVAAVDREDLGARKTARWAVLAKAVTDLFGQGLLLRRPKEWTTNGFISAGKRGISSFLLQCNCALQAS